jgi:hypothetical protein
MIRAHCSILKAIRPEKPTGVPPFFLSRVLCFGRLFFRFGGGQSLHNVHSLTSRSPVEDPNIRFSTFSSTIFLKSCRMFSPSSDVAAFLRFGPLFNCCIPDSSIASSRPSVLQGLLLQNRPWSPFSVGSRHSTAGRYSFDRFSSAQTVSTSDFLMHRYGIPLFSSDLIIRGVHRDQRPQLPPVLPGRSSFFFWVGLRLPRQASVASWQAVVSFRQASAFSWFTSVREARQSIWVSMFAFPLGGRVFLHGLHFGFQSFLIDVSLSIHLS